MYGVVYAVWVGYVSVSECDVGGMEVCCGGVYKYMRFVVLYVTFDTEYTYAAPQQCPY